ncbi:MAG TPA: hypothetical protein VGH28_14120 [Polyangiaceae bacterium]|jgi:hypothetical protein
MGRCAGGVAVKEHPILFSGPLVRAILEGRKSQTRRLAKFVPLDDGVNLGFSGLSVGQYNTGDLSSGAVLYSRGAGGVWNQRTKPLRYYALPGQTLWVRETWQSLHHNGVRTVYRADGEDPRTGWDDVPAEQRPPMTWRPSIFMRRADSRISLEVTGVRVERLHAITEEDAKAEGVTTSFHGCITIDGKSGPGTIHTFGPDARVKAFGVLWEAINGKRAPWVSNPWVWVVEFRRVQR